MLSCTKILIMFFFLINAIDIIWFWSILNVWSNLKWSNGWTPSNNNKLLFKQIEPVDLVIIIEIALKYRQHKCLNENLKQ